MGSFIFHQKYILWGFLWQNFFLPQLHFWNFLWIFLMIKTNPFTNHGWKVPWRYTSSLTKIMSPGHPKDQKWYHISKLSVPSEHIDPNREMPLWFYQKYLSSGIWFNTRSGKSYWHLLSQLFLSLRIPWTNPLQPFCSPNKSLHSTRPTKITLSMPCHFLKPYPQRAVDPTTERFAHLCSLPLQAQELEDRTSLCSH